MIKISNLIFDNRRRALIFFLVAQFLIYLDRGIIPGAHAEFQQFLSKSALCRRSPEVFFGLLQGSFIAGLSLGAPCLSFLATKYSSSIRFICIGLSIWLSSVVGCVVAGFSNSIPLLYISRAVSGVGEGAFVAICPPLLLDALPDEHKGTFIGLFYGLMPVGTAMGFVFSSASAHLSGSLSWMLSYIIEFSIFLPIILLLIVFAEFEPTSTGTSPFKKFMREVTPVQTSSEFSTASESGIIPSTPKNDSRAHGNQLNPFSTPMNNKPPGDISCGDKKEENCSLMASASDNEQREDIIICDRNNETDNTRSLVVVVCPLSPVYSFPLSSHESRDDVPSHQVHKVLSFRECASRIVLSPLFLSLLISNASLSALVASLSTFGVAMLLDLSFFQSEITASSVMGAVAAVAGTAGTLVGGKVLSSLLNMKRSGDHLERIEQKIESVILTTPRYKQTAPWEMVESFSEWNNRLMTTQSILSGLLPYAIIASLLLMAVPLLTYEVMFIGMLIIGLIVLFITQGGINLAIMMSVPDDYRSMSISLMTLGLHLLGDVPAPVVVGRIKDVLAPHCSGQVASSVFYPILTQIANSETPCEKERMGLLWTLFIVLAWSNFIWIGMMCGIAICKTRISQKEISLDVLQESKDASVA